MKLNKILAIILLVLFVVLLIMATTNNASAYYQTIQQPYNSFNVTRSYLNTYDRGVQVEPIRVNQDLHGNSYGNRFNQETGTIDFYRINGRSGVLEVDRLQGY